MINRRNGQATVEYILLMVILSGAILSLLKFSDFANSQLNQAKQGMVQKLSGDYQLQRSDFYASNIKKPGSGGEGSGAGGRGGRAGAGAGGTGGTGAAQTQTPQTAGAGTGEGGTEEPQAPTQEIRTRGGYAADEMTNDDRIQLADSYNEGAKAYGPAGEAGAEVATEEGTKLAQAEEEGARYGVRKGVYEDEYARQKALAAKGWNIGKFIIIILVLFFFFFIILKSRQQRD
ncbi:MAG: hypothetical protein V1647_05505 [Pseudomonadota bacterium]